jgi:decaprenyl-phosphate phosphoribosyltransferase
MVYGIIRTARIQQWPKNLIVFMAPGAAGVLLQTHALVRAASAFGLFCVAACGIYFMNDAIDVHADRAHPLKRHRPVAAGLIGTRFAGGTAAVLLSLSILAGTLLLGRLFGLCLAVYAAINLAYSLRLKREPILDIAAVASGFLIRAIAGGLAVPVPLSDWFLIVASFGSLFIVAGKRQADLRNALGRSVEHHGALGAYSQDYLRSVRTLSAAVAIAAYCVWAFQKASGGMHGAVLFELTIVPFVMAILRYALLVESGRGATPEDIVLGDRLMLGLGMAWGLLFFWAIYL